MRTVLNQIRKYKKIAPKVSGKRRERVYTMNLTGYLASSFPKIETEQKLGKGGRIDVMVGKIGIEAKCRPDQSEINRLYGQIDTYLQFLENIIVVFFDTDSGTLNDFKRKLTRGRYTSRVKVVQI